jgi:hypothetical protein
MDSLNRLQEIYYSADHAVAFIELIGSKESSDESPDLSQVTVFPLFRDGPLNYYSPQRQDLGGNSPLGVEILTGSYNKDSHLLSSRQFHADMDAALIGVTGEIHDNELRSNGVGLGALSDILGAPSIRSLDSHDITSSSII